MISGIVTEDEVDRVLAGVEIRPEISSDPSQWGEVKRKLQKSVPAKYRGIFLRTLSKGTRSRKDAIRAMCMECVCWQEAEVTRCPTTYCPLWPFRPGVKR